MASGQNRLFWPMATVAAAVPVLASLRVKLEGLYSVVLQHGSCEEVSAYAGAVMDVNTLLAEAEAVQMPTLLGQCQWQLNQLC